MMPKKIVQGMHKGKFKCTQYACLNNTGLQSGKIHYAEYPEGCCQLENPNIMDFSDDMLDCWGCGDERYGNEFKLSEEI